VNVVFGEKMSILGKIFLLDENPRVNLSNKKNQIWEENVDFGKNFLLDKRAWGFLSNKKFFPKATFSS